MRGFFASLRMTSKDKCNSNDKCNRRSLRDDNKKGDGKGNTKGKS
jgi:hypothetical protein